jgi:demethoxyubiquinone hydroxylase (CLK1/Coq7/Cat5 family)/predicted DCC family thiol-disulfide oxidoreductase YuxK
MNATTHPAARDAANDLLTVLYDGACPLCRREIAHARRLAERRGDARLAFVDIAADPCSGDTCDAAEREQLLARFHVQRADGSRASGAAAFVLMWSRLPGWRWLSRLARLPGVLPLLECAYLGFLRLRPALQRLAARLEPTPGLTPWLERELRSDHAGETGAVYIYRGVLAVTRDAELRAFAERHGATEAEHLRLVEAWLPPHRRSRLLGPWRLAGWLTGAIPALAGPRAVHVTIAAVETFVDRHYQAQLDHLRLHGGPPGLFELLERCQGDERHHRDEAAGLAGSEPLPRLPAAWCRLVSAGSAAAVVLARRV